MTDQSHPPSAADEARGWAALAAEVTDGVVGRTVHHVHRAVADRVFGLIGPLGTPVRLAHDAISEGVHVTVRTSFRALGAVGGEIAAARARNQERPWHERTATGSRLAAIAHGLLDDLPELAPALDLPLTIREAGATVPLRSDALATAFPTATGRVAVFLHGLVEDETIWGPSTRRPDRVCLPAAFAEHGFTPVRVRYGTGAAIARNGAALAEFLEQLQEAWPRPIEELVLVGHSMGGLVARSACRVAVERDHRWLRQLRHVAYLGSPHLGAPLERLVHRATGSLGWIPEVAPFLQILERRSLGIRDLRHGNLVEVDGGRVPLTDDELDTVTAPLPDDPWLDGVDHHLVVGRIARSERHPINRVLGDLLVTAPSAMGRSRERTIEGERVHVLPVAADHFALCWHPDVAAHLVDHVVGGTPTDHVAQG
jgi:pimeloyl-ACP methyl ester carboxylesterase